jgi:phosphatidylglycerol---prolipoprotein diacylglyceryl transferase
MHPELLRLHLFGHERPIYSYGVMILLGATAAILVGARRARSHGLEPFDVVAAGLLCACAGLFGAALLYLAINWSAFLDDPRAFLRQPGMVFYGGFIAAAGAAAAYVRAYRLPFRALADVAAVALPIGHALGRVGCFLGGCCYGRPTSSPLGVLFTAPGTPAAEACLLHGPIHPVQLYEAAGLLAIAGAIALAARRWRGRPPGALFLLYVSLYALLRLGTEALRGDFVERKFLVPGVLSTSQSIALGMLAFAAAGFLVLRHRGGSAYVALRVPSKTKEQGS